MAQRINVIVTCDLCQIHEEEVTDGAKEYTLIVDGEQVRLDICDPHAEGTTFASMVEEFKQYGTVVPSNVQKISPKRRNSVVPTRVSMECPLPDCPRNDLSERGLTQHVRQSHPENYEHWRKTGEYLIPEKKGRKPKAEPKAESQAESS